MKELNFVVRL